jgi:hypothetical protein
LLEGNMCASAHNPALTAQALARRTEHLSKKWKTISNQQMCISSCDALQANSHFRCTVHASGSLDVQVGQRGCVEAKSHPRARVG